MEERKLIRLGNSSFAIALPKDWVVRSGLKKGDKVFVIPNSNGGIIISPEFKKARGDGKEIVINVDEKEANEIAREIISAYIAGNKTISIIGRKEKIKKAKEISSSFLNLELIEENKEKSVFKDLLDIENIGIENFIKRMDNNLREMFSMLLETTKKGKGFKKTIKELYNIDKDITKFYFLIWRLMNIGIDNPSIQANLKLNPISFVNFFWVSYNIEHIGDELKGIAKKLNVIKGNKNYFAEVLKSINDDYSDSMKAFFDTDKELAKKVILRKESNIKMLEKLSTLKGFGAIAEKLQQISTNIHNNSKLIFYEV